MSILSFAAALLLTATTATSASGTGATADTLRAVTITAERAAAVSRADTVILKNALSPGEVLSGIPGICLSDNGGNAGLKTVSFRGLGSQHTSICIDGMRIGNVQSGQTDLGMIDLANCSSVIVDYARSSVSFNTAEPVFRQGSRSQGTVRIRSGSFGTHEPSGTLSFRISDSLTITVTASGTLSKGDFPCLSADGTTELRRENNDVKQIRGGIDLRGLTEGGDWHAKLYCNSGERGTPGSLSWPSTDRQSDMNAFAQATVRKRFSPKYMLNAGLKGSYDDILYRSVLGDSRYEQHEILFTSSHKYSLNRCLDLNGTADFQRDALESTLYRAERSTVVAAAAATFHSAKLKAGVTLEYSGIFDNADESSHIGTLSPAADIRWHLLDGLDLSAFGRRAYRTPTFNELYYPGFGNPGLKPEDAWLGDIGISFTSPSGKQPRTNAGTHGGAWSFSAKADAFFNSLKNKIISAPTEYDPSIWLPYNIGRARVAGADISAALMYSKKAFEAALTARYSLQNARDMSSGGSSSGSRIPFIARHSLFAGAECSLKNWSAALSWTMRKDRYDAAGRIPDYGTLDLDAARAVPLKRGGTLSLKLNARNLTDCRYELASGYPMPGRAFYCGIDFKF